MKPKSNNQNTLSKKKNFSEIYQSFTSHIFFLLSLLAIVSIVFFVNYSAIYDKKIDNNGDNIYYFSLGKSLSENQGFSNTMGFTVTPHFHFPPGYPAFVSCILKLYPDNIQAVKKANGVLLYVSIVLLFFIIWILTHSSLLAFASTLLCAMHRELLHYASIMMSETLYIFLSLLAVFLALLLSKWDIQKGKKWLLAILLILLAGTICYTYFVRTMGLSIVLAIAGWMGILSLISFIQWLKAKKANESEIATNYRKTFLLRLGVALIVIFSCGIAKISWDTRNKNLGYTGNSYAETFLMKENNETMSTWDDWKARISSNTVHFITRWIPEATYFKKYKSDDPVVGKEWMEGSVLLLALIIGSCYLGQEAILMLFYLFITIGVLIFYPEQYGGIRYIIPTIPFFIFLSLNAVAAIVALGLKIFKKKYSPLALQNLIVLIVALCFTSPYSKAQENTRALSKIKSWKVTTNVHMTNYITACEWCKENVPDTARLVCRKPELFYMYSGYHHSEMFPRYGEVDTIYNYFKNNHITHVIIDDWFRHGYVTIIPCIQKYPDKFKLLKQIGEVNLEQGLNPTYVFEFNDSWGYRGDTLNGKREGEGVLVMQDGRSYEGHFSNNLPNGIGTLRDPSGNSIKGVWKDGALIQLISQTKEQ